MCTTVDIINAIGQNSCAIFTILIAICCVIAAIKGESVIKINSKE